MKQISSILIANRGEIARRIIRTCRNMGIESVAVYSEPDAHAPFVKEADKAVALGGFAPNESYLVIDKIIQAAKDTGAQAIHPGYGFLSENAEFAKACDQAGIVFIGPNAEAIMAMGSKSNAKSIMQKHQVPTIPGYQGSDQSIKTLTKECQKIGFPLLLKATAGGGGKGMRLVNEANEIEKAIVQAKSESLAAFGDDELIIERYFPSARHIEFQIFGDQQGNILTLMERECSVQRRYQK